MPDLFKMIEEGANRLGNACVGAIDAVIGGAVASAPGALGSVASAATEAVHGINSAVSGFGDSIAAAAPLPAATTNPFAGIDLGGALSGLRACSVGDTNSLSADIGQFSKPLAHMAKQRSSGFALSA